MLSRKRTAPALLAPLALFLTVSAQPASATLLSQVIAGGQPIAVGDLLFSNFAVTAQSNVAADQIDVTTITDAAGNLGLRFSTSGLSIGVGGSNQLVADITFNAATAIAGHTVQSVHQSYFANLAPGPIAAFDFTTAGPAGSLTPAVATSCTGDGCPVIQNATDTALLNPSLASLFLDREVQLSRTRGAGVTGSVSAFDISFTTLGGTSLPPVNGGLPGGAPAVGSAPEPSSLLLLIGGALVLVGTRQRILRSLLTRATRP